MNTMGLNGRNIVITGASKGLGLICARELAGCGARLVLIARSAAKLDEIRKSLDYPDRHLCLPVDLTDVNQLYDGVESSQKFLGEIHVVLHVVGGGLGLRDPLLPHDDLAKLFLLNIGVAAEINRLVIPRMLKNGQGNLVHVGSIASDEATGSVGYNTVKAALAGYVRSLGRELAKSGLVATGILPGGFYAPSNSWERLEDKAPEVVRDYIEENLPRGFLGKAEELIPMILLLCSNDASMMAGCLVPVDAGEGRRY
tara:strand:- start:1186 stop:1953 length:768 start_codon:yes stop_codon:yes gene_type:complete